jgi:glycosyltransferase involved in cell wall biosynthesis
MEKLSAFVTTFNNDRTLASCLESVKWADEIVLLDSGSTDKTLAIAEQYGCQIFHHPFLGYGKQKQLALTKTTHLWVLLLDADEALSIEAQQEIRDVLRHPDADGYDIPRLEQMFWRMNNPHTRLNKFLRLFRKDKGHITDMPIHAAPKVDGVIKSLNSVFYHYGETDIDVKVSKLNAYSTGLVKDKVAKGTRPNPWMLVFYPPFYFLRAYFFKRTFMNGWGGFITSFCGAFYVFLKYAKLYEYHQRKRYGKSMMPPGAPDNPPVYESDKPC